MSLLANCRLKISGKATPGMILLTDRSLFLCGASGTAAHTGGLMGGLLGALIGSLVDSSRAQRSPPEHMTDPEVLATEPRIQKQLMKVQLEQKIALSDLFSVRPTFLGCRFFLRNGSAIEFQGAAHKKKVLTYLKERGVKVES